MIQIQPKEVLGWPCEFSVEQPNRVSAKCEKLGISIEDCKSLEEAEQKIRDRIWERLDMEAWP